MTDRERWRTRREAGICGECGKVPSTVYSRCSLCRTFVNEGRKKWWRRGAGRRLNRLKRERYAADPEPFKAQSRAFQKANREAERERHRVYYQAHRAEMLAKERARYQRRKAA